MINRDIVTEDFDELVDHLDKWYCGCDAVRLSPDVAKALKHARRGKFRGRYFIMDSSLPPLSFVHPGTPFTQFPLRRDPAYVASLPKSTQPPVLDGSRLPVNHDDEPTTWDRKKAYEAATAHLKPSTDPSVSPGDGGQVRQRRTPKPGIPHFRISWHPITGKPYFRWQNQEAKRWHITLLLISEDYQYFRGGIMHR